LDDVRKEGVMAPLNEPVWFSGRPGEGLIHEDPIVVPEFVDDAVGGGTSVLEFAVENFPNNSSGDGSFHGYGLDRGHMARSFDQVHTGSESDDGVMATTVHPIESVHALYDLVV
jgi:hypothetical protein